MALKQGSGTGKVHFGGLDDVSLYGTPVEPAPPASDAKQGFLRNQLQALFQPTDNKLAMKLFGSKKALMKERIRQKAAGHWVIHPCSSFRNPHRDSIGIKWGQDWNRKQEQDRDRGLHRDRSIRMMKEPILCVDIEWAFPLVSTGGTANEIPNQCPGRARPIWKSRGTRVHNPSRLIDGTMPERGRTAPQYARTMRLLCYY
ncbi:hypothetical protein EVAR_77223_1 [Eumeta japonica]|uniref:Ion transport N-terminal domain-containing protein n=1 Tax=Eumeta variegata TaxID=151549 RepID=A0A4C1T2Y9_EUMVA|nr:hypothetical protein EVAR_77223_1 [Eumeta japonica]